ncbi:MAG: 23S rRNA (uridine(2552)-2'-O)-methyltransferase RlmE [Gammaproteobacteria bacterium]
MSKSSKQWLQAHFKDPFVKKAQSEGYRSRAVYKLLELQEKYQFIHPGDVVVDLGAAPGGWSQIASEWVGENGEIFALDILDMEPLPGVTFIQGDFREDQVLNQLESVLNGREVDVVLSDMAPNLSGMSAVDQPRAMLLAEYAAEFAKGHLNAKGRFIVKVFQGDGFDEYLKELRLVFDKVIIRKPKSSKPKSREVYICCIGK